MFVNPYFTLCGIGGRKPKEWYINTGMNTRHYFQLENNFKSYLINGLIGDLQN